jgi:two-component system cell cycle sensor histidine kinase/response regulator CckA
VHAVSSGDEALAAIAAGKNVDLVVSDLVMPGIGGRELVDRLRSTHPALPVLYVSGYAADGPPVLEGDTRVGFLAKPFTALQLLTSVRSVLPAGLV